MTLKIEAGILKSVMPIESKHEDAGLDIDPSIVGERERLEWVIDGLQRNNCQLSLSRFIRSMSDRELGILILGRPLMDEE